MQNLPLGCEQQGRVSGLQTLFCFCFVFFLAGNKCVVYDAVFHPDTYNKGQEVRTMLFCFSYHLLASLDIPGNLAAEIHHVLCL